MNKFKFLLFVATFILVTNVANAGSSIPWCNCRVFVKAEKEDGTTGGGKVYASESQSKQSASYCTNSTYMFLYGRTCNDNFIPCPIYLSAAPDTEHGWEFDYWECTLKAGTYNNASGATNAGTKLYEAFPEVQYAGLSIQGGEPNTGDKSETTTWTTDTNAIWIAHFKRIQHQDVTVQSENTSLGSATIDNVTNYVGDQVTISAWSGNSSNNPRSETIMFKGWYRLNENTGEKEFVTKEPVYTFTITNGNKGAYFARFEGGYSFWRLKNQYYGHYLTSVKKYTGEVTSTAVRTAIGEQLSVNDDFASSITDAGTMMKLWIQGKQPGTSKEILDIYVQDEHTNQYYGDELISQGVFLQLTHVNDNSYYIQGNNASFTVVETDNKKIDISFMAPQTANWRLEGMDKDLTTKENYFTVAPAEFVGPDNDGYYWTTLRVCFNMKYETSEMTPFIVTAADASTGEMELTEVTGGIIPEKTCVLLRCNSTDVTRNVMIPTTTTASFSPTGNLLTSSTYYYKNQSVSSSLNLKGIKLVDGRLGFGGSTKTSVDGNRAYLSIADDVSLKPEIPEITLAALIASGDTQNTYSITDLKAVEFVDHGTMLICKDDNGYASKDVCNNDDYIDFMHTATQTVGINSTIPTTYDQSNWIGLRLPDGAIGSVNLLGCPLTGVVGKLTNTVNPEFALEQVPEANGGYVSYTPNVYIAASFNSSNPQTSSVTGKQYFFVQPKPMEIANIEWVQWNGEKFVSPVANDANPTWNQAQLTGEFEFNGSMLEQGGVFLETGHCYEMTPALIRFKEGNYDHVYVLGNVNGIGWDPHKGVEMYTNDGNIYTATVTVNASEGEYGFFSFTKKLGEWDDIKGYRFGAVADGANYYVDPNYLGMELPLAFWSSDSRSFQLAQGTYRLMVNLSTLKLVITPVQYGAPSLRDGNQFVVYPTVINKVTTENNGVITAIDNITTGKVATRTTYYNTLGVASATPHSGVNIVVTEYNDGSRTAVKMMK